MVSVKQLYFERDDKRFFHGLSFEVVSGQLLQITGANGVGKTTLLRLLAGILPIYSGSIHVPSEIAFIGHQAGLSGKLTVVENLQFIAKLYGGQPKIIPGLLTQFSLSGVMHQFANALSAGQQRRLAFASLLLMQAKLWLLDEPFTALDQSAMTIIQTLIQQHLLNQGIVILTSHQTINWENIHMQTLHLEESTCHYSG